MTLQVALVGTDGIVLGSDRKRNTILPDGPTTSSEVSKIIRDDSRGVMACWSGVEPAIEVAKQVVRLPDNEIQNPTALESLATRIFADELKRLELIETAPAAGEVILVVARDLNTIYHIKVQKRAACWQVLDKVVSGHVANPAVYFLERFYQKKMGTGELLPLVAHTILEAGRINPAGIQGLEIVCCSRDGLKPVPEERISELTNLSERVEREIRTLLFTSD